MNIIINELPEEIQKKIASGEIKIPKSPKNLNSKKAYMSENDFIDKDANIDELLAVTPKK